ncbi:MAG TPA: nuclear transport factor 2 family protein [Caulobacterales bacterium]|nr:nuclear transport factor 2 family protein [Caulobacterales bacterium]
MERDLERDVRALLDKEAIRECFLRYTRGIDRLDVDMIKSAFHEDAIDNHARGVQGSIDDMLRWWLPQQPSRDATQHFVTNQTIELDGDSAHVETYFLVIIKQKAREDAALIGGRYADRFERRKGTWRIALRVVLPEWQADLDARGTELVRQGAAVHGARDPSDVTYQRPLRNPSS